MELIIAAIAFVILFWLMLNTIINPPKKKVPKTPEQELADAVMKVVKSRTEEKK